MYSIFIIYMSYTIFVFWQFYHLTLILSVLTRGRQIETETDRQIKIKNRGEEKKFSLHQTCYPRCVGDTLLNKIATGTNLNGNVSIFVFLYRKIWQTIVTTKQNKWMTFISKNSRYPVNKNFTPIVFVVHHSTTFTFKDPWWDPYDLVFETRTPVCSGGPLRLLTIWNSGDYIYYVIKGVINNNNKILTWLDKKEWFYLSVIVLLI